MLPPGTKLIEEFFIASEIREVASATEAGLHRVVGYERRDEPRNMVVFSLTFEVSPEITWDCGRIVLRQPTKLPKWLAPRLGKRSVKELVPKEWTKVTASIGKGSEWNAVSQHKKALRGVVGKFSNLQVFSRAGTSSAPPNLVQEQIESPAEINLPSQPHAVHEESPLSRLPEIPAHTLKDRREYVRKLKIQGKHTRKQIAMFIGESESVVKKDLEWLRKRDLMGEDFL